MTRVQKLFLQKIAKPVFTTVTVVGTITATHFAATMWGYTLAHVVLALFYIVPAVCFLAGILYVLFVFFSNNWHDAREEVEQENETLIEVLKR